MNSTHLQNKLQENNKIDWNKTKCIICGFVLSVGARFGPESEEMTYCGFVVKKEHSFSRNVYDNDVLEQSDRYKDLKTSYGNFERFLKCCVLLDKYYTSDSEIENIDHDCVEEFLTFDLQEECQSFLELFDLTD